MLDAITDTFTPNNNNIRPEKGGVVDRKFERLLNAAISKAQDEVEEASDDDKLDTLAAKLPEGGNATDKVRKAFQMVRDGHELLGHRKALLKAFNAILTPAGSIRDDHAMPDFLMEEKFLKICKQIDEDRSADNRDLAKQHLGGFRKGKATTVDVKVFEAVYGEVAGDAVNGDIDIADIRAKAVKMREVYKFEFYRTIELASNGCNGLDGIRTRVNTDVLDRNAAAATEANRAKDKLGPVERLAHSLQRTAKRVVAGHKVYGVAESNIVDSDAKPAKGDKPPVDKVTLPPAASANAEKLAKSAEAAKKKS